MLVHSLVPLFLTTANFVPLPFHILVPLFSSASFLLPVFPSFFEANLSKKSDREKGTEGKIESLEIEQEHGGCQTKKRKLGLFTHEDGGLT